MLPTVVAIAAFAAGTGPLRGVATAINDGIADTVEGLAVAAHAPAALTAFVAAAAPALVVATVAAAARWLVGAARTAVVVVVAALAVGALVTGAVLAGAAALIAAVTVAVWAGGARLAAGAFGGLTAAGALVTGPDAVRRSGAALADTAGFVAPDAATLGVAAVVVALWFAAAAAVAGDT